METQPLDALDEAVSCAYASQLHEAPGVWAEARGLVGDTAHTEAGPHGLVPSAALVVDSSALAGGWAGRGLFDVGLDADLDELAGLRHTELHVEVYGVAGRDANALVGTLQGVSNVDAEQFLRFAEVWTEHHFTHAVRVKAGRIDSNTEFDAIGTGGVFLHPAAGVTPAMFAAPLYPTPALGAVAGAQTAVFDVRVGVWPDADGGFGVAEVDAGWEGGRAGVGAWADKGAWARFDGGAAEATFGGFVLAEQQVWGGLAAFVQAGAADPRIAVVDAHVSGGLAWAGAIPARADDTAGVYASWAHASTGSGLASELAVEALYKAQVASPASVALDVMHIRSEDIGGRWVGTVRTEMAF